MSTNKLLGLFLPNSDLNKEGTLHLLHTLCLWAAESVVKKDNAYIHRGAARDIKYKYKLGHSTCDSQGIYPEQSDLHTTLCFTHSNGSLKTLL